MSRMESLIAVDQTHSRTVCNIPGPLATPSHAGLGQCFRVHLLLLLSSVAVVLYYNFEGTRIDS